MTHVTGRTFKELAGLLVSPPVDPRLQAARITFMEENVLLPIKAIVIGMLFYFLFISDSFRGVKEIGDLPMKTVRTVFFIYMLINIIGAAFLISLRRFSLSAIQWIVFGLNLLDAIFLAAVTLLTGGLNTFAYWVFLGFIVRNAVSVPEPALQITLNLLVIGCYAAAGFSDKFIIDRYEIERQFDLEDVKVTSKEVGQAAQSFQPYVIRIFLMISLTACCYGLQVLFDKQRKAEEDMEELVLRQEQLQAAGRLAAEIAHQLKNPLAIINNSAFTLQRACKDGKNGDGATLEQLDIIRDEVDRSDRIITELMGYAQLAEGKVEKIEVSPELTEAIEQVFPAGARFQVKVHREEDPSLPSLHMQRGHFRAMLVNLLQNAREASPEGGNVRVRVRVNEEFTVVFTVEDEGPGVPPERVERVFEPYFTTKEKGTGLGLAIVKHNAEIYGGTVRVESGLGRGARFILELPVKTMMRFRK
ncbi:MAG: ATP-binding protein [Verrucomicrobiota bacterium]